MEEETKDVGKVKAEPLGKVETKIEPSAAVKASRLRQTMSRGKPKKVVSLGVKDRKSRRETKVNKDPIDQVDEDESPDEDYIPHLPPECCEHYNADNKDSTDGRNQMEVSWFQKINMSPEEQKSICFSESLLMVDETGKIAGKMYTTVSESKWGDQHCLCAHSGSFGTLADGLECGTTITGFVSFDMRTLQEYVYEWAIAEGKVIERKTFIMREEETVHVRIVLLRDGETAETKVVTLGRLEQHNLVTESSHIILLRLLLMHKRTQGGMDLRTLTFQGKVVKNKYGELGTGWENVKGETVRTWSIRRTVEFDFGDRLWDSILSEHGRLILRCQPENTHALIPLWFEPVKVVKDGKFTSCYPPYVWACDAELYSKYLLKKDQLAAEHRSYLLDHPELRALMSDFLQALLLRKPQSVIPFTQQYFESFLKLRPQTHNSNTDFSSSYTASSVGDQGEWGEWIGEGGDDSLLYYQVRPTVSDDGLEKIFPDEFTSGDQDPSADDNVSVGPDGKYISTL